MHASNCGHSSQSNTSHKGTNVLKLLPYLLVKYFLLKFHFLVVKYNVIFTSNDMIESKIIKKTHKIFKFSSIFRENVSPIREMQFGKNSFNLCLIQLQAHTRIHGITKRCCRGLSTLASPLGGAVFNSLLGDNFNYLDCNLVSISPSRQVLRQHLKWAH